MNNEDLINKSVMDDKIFEFVYVAAMRDATLQKSYKGKKAWLTDCNQFESTNDLKGFVEAVMKGELKERKVYDKRFLSISKKVCGDINNRAKEEGGGHFTFGNAQKLINIMMKYFYIHSYGNKEEKKYYQHCHCPMDSQLLNIVWKNRSELKDKGESLGERDDFLKSWGNEDFKDGSFPNRYTRFQEAVKELSENEKINPLEFDYYVWGNTTQATKE